MIEVTADAMVRQLQVEELVARYNWAWDHHDVQGVVDCFTADGVFVDAAGGAHRGSEGVRGFVEASFSQFGQMRHMTMSHLLSPVDSSRAQHRCYVLFVSHPEDARVLDTGEYEDEIVWEAGSPRFHARMVRFD